MLRDRGPADRQLRGELTHRLRPLGQAGDDGATRAVCQRPPAFVYSVSIH
jgi:hypothetical protein